MAKITRYTGNVKAFGEDAQAGERTVFGNDAATSDTLDGNMVTDFFRGWGIISKNGIPPKQFFNAFGFAVSKLIAYLHQVGVPEWDVAQEYHTGSFVNRNGALYVSQSNTNVGNDPATDAVNWSPIEASQVGFTDPASLTDNVQSALAAAIRGDATTLQGVLGGLSVYVEIPAGADTADAPALWPGGVSVSRGSGSNPIQTPPGGDQSTEYYTFGRDDGTTIVYTQLAVSRNALAPRLYLRFGISGSAWGDWKLVMGAEPPARWAAGVQVSSAAAIVSGSTDSAAGRNDPADWIAQGDGAFVVSSKWQVRRVSGAGAGEYQIRVPDGRDVRDYHAAAWEASGLDLAVLRNKNSTTFGVRSSKDGIYDDVAFIFQALRVT